MVDAIISGFQSSEEYWFKYSELMAKSERDLRKVANEVDNVKTAHND